MSKEIATQTNYFPEGHPLAELNGLPPEQAIEQMKQSFHFVQVFSTIVRNRLEPILSIETEKIDKNKILGVVISVAKSAMQESLTPKFMKSGNEEDGLLTNIDKQFADAGMPLNLKGIFSMPERERGFLLEFIRTWGAYNQQS